MPTTISSLMNHPVHLIDSDATVAELDTLFAREGLSWAPVVEAGRTLLGVISASDLRQFHGRQQDPDVVRARQLCACKPLTVPADALVSDVARLMCERQVHHVVVIDGIGIVGLVSSLDFVRTFVHD